MPTTPGFCLLIATLLLGRAAAAQPAPATRLPALPQLPAAALQATATSTVLPPANGMRFQYRSVRVYNDQLIYLAPAWRGLTKLEPPKHGLFSGTDPGELDALLLTTLNDLADEGWELIEIQSSVQPTSATQKIETDLAFNDPNRPTYKGTTSIATLTQTRYLFRRPLGK